MKRILALLLAVIMVLSMAACGNKNTETPTEPENPPVEVPASALEILETVWALYGDDEKFPVMGGDANNMVDGAPGAFGLEDADMATYQLLVPAEQLANVTEAASMIHMMNANTFTCGVYHLTDSANMSKVSDSLKTAISGKQWMCGFPDTLIIISVGSDYILSAYGNAEIIENFKTKVLASYSGSAVLLEEVPLAA